MHHGSNITILEHGFGPNFDFELEGNAGWCPGGFPPYDQDEGFQDGDAGLIMPSLLQSMLQ